MQLADLYAAVRLKYTAETVDDATLAEFAEAALRFYNRYNPQCQEEVLTTTADTENYNVSKTFLYVEDVVWYPGGNVNEYTLHEYNLLDVKNLSLPYYGEPSLRQVDVFNDSEYYKHARGFWEVRGQDIYLRPTPEYSDLDVLVRYHTARGVADVPDDDFDLLRDLILAEIVEARGLEAASGENYAEGLQRVVRQYAAQNSLEWVRRLRQKTIDKYRATMVVA